MTIVGVKQEGDDLYKQGKYADAIIKYTSAIEKCTNPAAYDIHLTYSNRSACYMHLNMLDKALDDASICVALKPTWAKGHSRKGACLAALNRNQEAIECYERVLQLDRSNTEATNAISRLSRNQSSQNASPRSANNHSGNTGTSTAEPSSSFDWRAMSSTILNSITSFYYRCLSWWQDLSPNTQLYIQVGCVALFLYVIFFRPFSSGYDSGYGYSSAYNYGGYGGGYGGYGGYGGGMSWTPWGLIMLAAYKVPPMLPDLLGEQYARPFFGMSWTTFMWLLQMFTRNTAGMGGFGRGMGGGYGMPGGGMFGQRRRYY